MLCLPPRAGESAVRWQSTEETQAGHPQAGNANPEEAKKQERSHPDLRLSRGRGPRERVGAEVITWWDLADGGRVPAVALVAVGGLHEDGAVAEALGEDLAPDVVQPHASP